MPKFDIKSMAIMLGWPYRTYQDRELGHRGIPQKAVDQVLEAQKRNNNTMNRIKKLITDDINAKYPMGIQ